jgi:FdhE protein
VTLDDWLRSHRFLDPLARVRRRIDTAVADAVTRLPPFADWDEYVEDFADGVPLLRSEARIDLEPVGQAVLAVLHSLASDTSHAAITDDATALVAQLQRDPDAARRVIDWLMGDDSWEPARGGLLRSAGWITSLAALRPLVQGFAGWRDEDHWLRRYCPTCGALPAMAQLVGIDPGRLRLLVCGRCDTRWRFGRTACPFCETASHRLASVGVEGEAGLRIDYCDACRGYLKTYNGQGHEDVLLADWTSLHLDVVARDRGLKRLANSLYELAPTQIDVPSQLGAASGISESDSSVRSAAPQ